MTSVFVAIVWTMSHMYSISGIVELSFLSIGFGLVFALIGFFSLIATERSVLKNEPFKLSTVARLSDRRAISEPCALAVLRGTLIGLFLLGMDTFLVWLGTGHLGVRLDSFWNIVYPGRMFLNSQWTPVSVIVGAFLQSFFVGIVVGFLASFVPRFVTRHWLGVLFAAALAAVVIPGPYVGLGAVQPYHWKLLLLFFDCLVLVLVFRWFDLLTLFWAVFTAAFCWGNYFMLVMNEPLGQSQELVTFALWATFVIAAWFVAFKAPLLAAYKRIAVAFE